MAKASEIGFPDEFSPAEWPFGVLDRMDSTVMRALFSLRKASGIVMRPSPVQGGHARDRGDSRHSTKGGIRLSDATDIFVGSLADLATVFRHAQRVQGIGGIGLYFDTRPGPMFHIDCRPDRLLWVRVDGEYHYEVNDPAAFYALLGQKLGGN